MPRYPKYSSEDESWEDLEQDLFGLEPEPETEGEPAAESPPEEATEAVDQPVAEDLAPEPPPAQDTPPAADDYWDPLDNWSWDDNSDSVSVSPKSIGRHKKKPERVNPSRTPEPIEKKEEKPVAPEPAPVRGGDGKRRNDDRDSTKRSPDKRKDRGERKPPRHKPEPAPFPDLDLEVDEEPVDLSLFETGEHEGLEQESQESIPFHKEELADSVNGGDDSDDRRRRRRRRRRRGKGTELSASNMDTPSEGADDLFEDDEEESPTPKSEPPSRKGKGEHVPGRGNQEQSTRRGNQEQAAGGGRSEQESKPRRSRRPEPRQSDRGQDNPPRQSDRGQTAEPRQAERGPAEPRQAERGQAAEPRHSDRSQTIEPRQPERGQPRHADRSPPTSSRHKPDPEEELDFDLEDEFDDQEIDSRAELDSDDDDDEKGDSEVAAVYHDVPSWEEAISYLLNPPKVDDRSEPKRGASAELGDKSRKPRGRK